MTDRSKLFTKYVSTIKVLSLPLSYSCTNDMPVLEIDPALSSSFKSAGWCVSGRIYPKEKYVTIIQGQVDYSYYPSIYIHHIFIIYI